MGTRLRTTEMTVCVTWTSCDATRGVAPWTPPPDLVCRGGVNVPPTVSTLYDARMTTSMVTDADWDGLREALERLQREVAEEIHGYPAPIPACDAQFNHLLELRRLVPQELARLERARSDRRADIAGFVRSSPLGAQLSAALRGRDGGQLPGADGPLPA